MPDNEALQNALEKSALEETREIPRAPEPTAIGNDSIAIYNHRFTPAARDSRSRLFPAHVALAIGNETNTALATVVLEAAFYDQQGNIVETVRHREVDLRPSRSRAVRIPSSSHDACLPKSYAVKIIRASTVDFEPVQLRRRTIRTTADGQEQISGTVVNISEAKADAAVIATFFDFNEENIGIVVLPLRDIEPGAVRTFELNFRPQEGERVSRCTIQVGTLAG